MSQKIMFETLKVAAEGRIGTLVLNRPERLNALSVQTLEEIARAARWFDDREEVRVVIVSGAGRSFSAGADLGGFPGPGDAGLRAAADAGRLMADALENIRAVSIACIQGWCVGGGIVVASACDLRLAAEDARFSIPEVDLGIPLAWGGIPRLVREIGPALTKELVITCRPFDAAEARAAGFLNRVVPPERLQGAARELAELVASKPALPTLATKRQTNAVTAQMVGTARGWSDADSLIAALVDPECERMREAYIREKLG